MPGYKVSVELSGARLPQVGICADSLSLLKNKVQEKFLVQGPVAVFLEDGTLVCDEDYFSSLEPQTKLFVRPAPAPSLSLLELLGQKRMAEPAFPPPSKRSTVDFSPAFPPPPLLSPPLAPAPALLPVHSPPFSHSPPTRSSPFCPAPRNMPGYQMQGCSGPMQYIMQTRSAVFSHQNPHVALSPPMPGPNGPPSVTLSYVPGQCHNNFAVRIPRLPSAQRLQAASTLQSGSAPQPIFLMKNPSYLDPPQLRQLPPLIKIDSTVTPKPTTTNPKAVNTLPPPTSKPAAVSEVSSTSDTNSKNSILPSGLSPPPETATVTVCANTNNNNASSTATSPACAFASTSTATSFASPLHVNVHENVLKMLKCIEKRRMASKPNDLSIHKDSTDEGYSSGCPTASPSPSTTEMPVPFVNKKVTTIVESASYSIATAPTPSPKALMIQEECQVKTFAELATPVTTASGSTRLTDMLAAQPIPDILKADLMDTLLDESDIPEDNVETSCKESTPADELSLVVTIPVHIKNGHIHAQETTTQEATLPEVIVIDDEIEHPVVSEDVVSGACSKSHSEQQVTVSEYASEEIALTSLPQSTADQVNETVSHLLSAALKTSDAIQTKSEIETLLSSISKSSVHQTVLLDSTVFDKEEQEYVHFDYYDIQSILSPKGCEDENTNEVCSDEPHVVDVSSEDGPAVVVDVSDIACEVVVSDNDEPDSVCESEDLASVLMANAFHIHSDEPSVQKTIDTFLVHADSLSETDSNLVRSFLSGSPTDPRHRCRIFPFRRLSNGNVLSLQLNFLSGEWQGYVSHSDSV